MFQRLTSLFNQYLYIYTLFKKYSMNKVNVQALFKMHSFIDPPNSLQFFLIFLSSIFLYFHNFKNAGKEKAHNIKCYISGFFEGYFWNNVEINIEQRFSKILIHL